MARKRRRTGSINILPLGHCVYVLTTDRTFGRDLWKSLTAEGREVCAFERLDDLVASAPGRPPAVVVLDGALRSLSAREIAAALRPPDSLTRALVAIVERRAVPSPLNTLGAATFVLPEDDDRLLGYLLQVSRSGEGGEPGQLIEVPASIPPAALAPVEFDPDPSVDLPMQALDTVEIPAIPRILVADHDRVVRQLISHECNRAGWQVFQATDGDKAMESIETIGPHVVVADADLPLRNAFDLLAAVNPSAGGTRSRFIVLSAEDPNDGAVRAFTLGADDFVAKPVNPQVLVWRLKRILSPRRSV